MLDPVAMNERLVAKGEGRLRRQLREADFGWFFQLLVAIIKKKQLRPNSPVCQQFIFSLTREGNGWQLLDYFTKIYLELVETEQEEVDLLVLFYYWLGKFPHLTAQILKKGLVDKTFKSQLQYFLLAWLKKERGKVKIVEENNQETFSTEDEIATFLWPVNSRRQELAQAWLTEVQEILATEVNAIKTSRVKKPDWEIVDCLWKRIENEAWYGLHLDGDLISFDIPQLRQIRLTGATLHPNDSFPQAGVVIHADTLGIKEDLPFDLDRGRLIYTDKLWGDYFCWLLTTAVLVGYWQIVGPTEEISLDKGVGSDIINAGNRSYQRRPFKPHTPRLPEGQHASQQAIQACLKCLNRPPASGRTFRSPKNNGPITCQGKLSVRITPQTILGVTKVAI